MVARTRHEKAVKKAQRSSGRDWAEQNYRTHLGPCRSFRRQAGRDVCTRCGKPKG